jgi:hypothetical protein
MKRAGTATLDRVAPLLAQLRANPALRERRPGHFHLSGREFLHFHDDPDGVFADVRLSEGFVRLRVSTGSEQADLLDRIEACLSSVEARARGKRRGAHALRRGHAR